MSSPPVAARIAREDLPGSPDWVERLLEVQNPFNAGVAESLARALTVGENLSSQLVTVEVVAPSPIWTPIVFTAGNWVFYGGDLAPPAYQVEPGGWISLRGSIKNGALASTDIYFFPIGCRPEYTQYFTTDSAGATATEIGITRSGGLRIEGGATSGLQLDGIRWQAAAPAAAPLRPVGAGWPFAIRLTIPRVAWVQVVHAVDLSASSSGNTTLAPAAVPEWTLGTSGEVLILHVPGLTQGRKYRLTFLLLAG